MKEINSVNNTYIKEISKLKEKKYRDEKHKFLIEGYNLIEEAKKMQILDEVFITTKEDEVKGIENTIVTKEIIKKLSDTVTPQNIIGVCKVKENIVSYQGNVLILDGIQDPGNFGTLVRSALSFNVKDIIISQDTVDMYNPKFIRSTQGSFFNINIVRRDILEEIKKLKTLGYTIIGTDVNDAMKLKALPEITKYALILGSEGNGVKKDVLSKTDYNITIETTGLIDSLNVAIAGSIIMYSLMQKAKS